MMLSSYFRYPHLHGDLLTFVAEDDVWVAPLDGGRAWRISAMQLPARNPRFSPDGSSIAWTVIAGSAPEVVTAAVDGGEFRQLTHWGHASTKVKGFSPSGDILATSSFQRHESRHTWAYAVPLDGRAPSVLPYGPVDSLTYGPAVGDERPVVLSTVLSREPAWWKRYRGGTAGKLWIDPDGSGDFARLVPALDGNLSDPMWIGNRIAFLSDHEGYGNLYSVRPDGSGLRRHTDQEDFYVRHATSDGRRIVFESAGSLHLLDSLDAQAVPLNLSLGSASAARRHRPLKVTASASEVVPDHTGRASVVEVHGTVHWLTHRDGPSRVLEATPGVRARLARPLLGGKVVYVADHGGVEALYLKDAFTDSGPVRRSDTADTAPAVAGGRPQTSLPQPVSAAEVTGDAGRSPRAEAPAGPASSGNDGGATAPGAAPGHGPGDGGGTVRIELPQSTRVSEIVSSPDGTLAAVATEFGEVLLLDTGSAQLRQVSSTEHGAIDDVAFSPDSAWISWAEPMSGEGGHRKIRLARATDDSSSVIDLTDGRFHDHSPAFTGDGKFLAFLSERSFDPVYDTHRFDLSFPSSTKPFLIALAAATPSPFGPAVDGVEPDPDESDAAHAPVDPGAAPSSSADTTVTIDTDQITERIIPIPVPQGSYDQLSTVDGGLLWTAEDVYGVTGEGRASISDKDPARRIERFDFDTRETSVLVPAVTTYRLTGDSRHVVTIHENRVRMVAADAKVDEDSGKSITIDLLRIRVQLEPLQVWAQAFDEAWRLQRDFYWAPDMAGIDWQGVYDRYRPLVERLGSHDDLVDLLWELHGELGTSHAYVTPKLVTEPGAGRQGLLGADLRPTETGWEIARILPGESSDPMARSPLTAPGVAAKVGDVITAVDGNAASGGRSLNALLVGAADKIVELTLVNGDAHGEAAGTRRRIAVVPVPDEERLRYQDWVGANRRIVRDASGGSFGYLHIPDMVARGWSQLHRDLESETAKDALVVDVRGNRGGHTSQLVAELIGRRVNAWSLPRGQQPETYPAHAPRGPVVILADEFAGSDGDIITQVSKQRAIGPVIGTRTWGGVIGIDGRFQLADGTAVTQPRYAFWFTGGIGWAVENYGVEPDIEVPFPPHAYAAGDDPQLEHGVGVLKEMVSELPTDRPPKLADYPSRRPAPLPPRQQD